MKRSIRTCSLLASVASFAACAKKTPEPEAPVAAAPAPTPPAVDPAKSDAEAAARIAANLRRVHFEFNSDELTQETQSALSENAQILKAHPAISIEVQGHCDDRGTTEYNLSLGQRRAEAVRKYLVRSAVPESQVKTITFGKEKPIAMGAGEPVWSQNRRAEFRVLTKVAEEVHGSIE
jgi:peptidoglycan-associated lipoprotein